MSDLHLPPKATGPCRCDWCYKPADKGDCAALKKRDYPVRYFHLPDCWDRYLASTREAGSLRRMAARRLR